jgi:hypothetical protein
MSNSQKYLHDSQETRIALLEQSIGHITQTLLRIEARLDRIETEVKSDFRWLLGMMIVFSGVLMGTMAHGFHWI